MTKILNGSDGTLYDRYMYRWYKNDKITKVVWYFDIIRSMYSGLHPWFLAWATSLCNFLSSQGARKIFCSYIWSLTLVPIQSSQILWDFLGDRNVFFLIRHPLVTSWKASGWGWVTSKPKLWLETWDFQCHPPSFWEGRGDGDWVNGPSCLCNETSISISNFQVGEHMHMWGGWCTPSPQDQRLLCSGLFRTPPYVSLHLTVHLNPLSYPLITWWS